VLFQCSIHTFSCFLLTLGLPVSALNFPMSSATPMASIADTTCTTGSHIKPADGGRAVACISNAGRLQYATDGH
jgi:hypothetical protein